MDKFNVVWCTVWSDFFMAQHQYDTDSLTFQVTTDGAADFLFYLHNLLGHEKNGHYIDDDKQFVAVKLTPEEVEKITDWIMNFNLTVRKPVGIPMPDFYLDEEKIEKSTVNVYCHRFVEFILYILKKQHIGRDEIADWALKNIMNIYMKAYSDALFEKRKR